MTSVNPRTRSFQQYEAKLKSRHIPMKLARSSTINTLLQEWKASVGGAENLPSSSFPVERRDDNDCIRVGAKQNSKKSRPSIQMKDTESSSDNKLRELSTSTDVSSYTRPSMLMNNDTYEENDTREKRLLLTFFDNVVACCGCFNDDSGTIDTSTSIISQTISQLKVMKEEKVQQLMKEEKVRQELVKEECRMKKLVEEESYCCGLFDDITIESTPSIAQPRMLMKEVKVHMKEKKVHETEEKMNLVKKEWATRMKTLEDEKLALQLAEEEWATRIKILQEENINSKKILEGVKAAKLKEEEEMKVAQLKAKKEEAKAAQIKAKEKEVKAAKMLLEEMKAAQLKKLKEEDELKVAQLKDKEEDVDAAKERERVNRRAARGRLRSSQHNDIEIVSSGGDCDGDGDMNTKSMTEAMKALQQSSSMADDDSKDYTRVTATGLATNTNDATKKTNSYKMLPPWKAAARREARKAMIDDIQKNAQVKMNSQARLKAKKKKKNKVVNESEARRDEALFQRHCGVFDGLPGASSISVSGDMNDSSILVDTIEALQRSSSLALASVTSLAFGATDDDAIAPATNKEDDDVHNTIKLLSADIAEASEKVIHETPGTNDATTIVKPVRSMIMSTCDQSEAAQRSSVCVEYTVADYKQATKRDPRWLLLMARNQISMKKRASPIAHQSNKNAINMGVKILKLRSLLTKKMLSLSKKKKFTEMDQERTSKDMNVQTDESVLSKLTKSTRLSKDNIEVTETELLQHLNNIESEWKSAWPMNSSAVNQADISVLSVSFDSNDIIIVDDDFINVGSDRNNTHYCGFSPNCGGSLGPILEENSMSFSNRDDEDNSIDDYSSITGTNQLSYETTSATSIDGTEVSLFMCGNDRNN